MNELLTAKTFSDAERMGIQIVANELQENVCSMEMQLNALRDDFPISFSCALTNKAVRMLLCERRRTWVHYAEMGLITDKELSSQLDDINLQSPSADMFRQWLKMIRKL